MGTSGARLVSVADDLTREIARIERDVVPKIHPDNGIGLLLVRKALGEARRSIESRDEDRQRFYLDTLKRAAVP